MRTQFKDIRKGSLFAGSTRIGTINDLLLEEGNWMVRYFVIEQASRGKNKRLLISPSAVNGWDNRSKRLSTSLAVDELNDCPPLSEHEPVSRQYEKSLVEYFGWPIYWLGRSLCLAPQTLERLAGRGADVDRSADVERSEDKASQGDSNESGIQTPPDIATSTLRSAKELRGYQIRALDGPVGELCDLSVHTKDWTVDFAIANLKRETSRTGSHFSTRWIRKINWRKREVEVDLRVSIFDRIEQVHSRNSAVTREPYSTQSEKLV